MRGAGNLNLCSSVNVMSYGRVNAVDELFSYQFLLSKSKDFFLFCSGKKVNLYSCLYEKKMRIPRLKLS